MFVVFAIWIFDCVIFEDCFFRSSLLVFQQYYSSGPKYRFRNPKSMIFSRVGRSFSRSSRSRVGFSFVLFLFHCKILTFGILVFGLMMICFVFYLLALFFFFGC